MKIQKDKYTVLISDDGFVLTNGTVYAKKVILGVADSPQNWSEITDGEYSLIKEKELQEV